jgi:hypothetical protein
MIPYKDMNVDRVDPWFTSRPPPHDDTIEELMYEIESLKSKIWMTDPMKQDSVPIHEPIPKHSGLYNPNLDVDKQQMIPLFIRLRKSAKLINVYIIWFLHRMMFLEFQGEPTFDDLYTITLNENQNSRQLFLKHFRYTYYVLTIFEEMANNMKGFENEKVLWFVLWMIQQEYFYLRPEILLVALKIITRLQPDYPDRIPYDYLGDLNFQISQRVTSECYQQPEIPQDQLCPLLLTFMKGYPFEFMAVEAMEGIRYFTPLLLAYRETVLVLGSNIEWVITRWFTVFPTLVSYPAHVKKIAIDSMNYIIETLYDNPDMNIQLSLEEFGLCKFIVCDFGEDPFMRESLLRFIHMTTLNSMMNYETQLFEVYFGLGVYDIIAKMFNTIELSEQEVQDVGKIFELLASAPDEEGRYLNVIREGKFIQRFYVSDFNNVFLKIVAKMLGRNPHEQKIEQYEQRLIWLLFGKSIPAGRKLGMKNLNDDWETLLMNILAEVICYFIKDGVEMLYTLWKIGQHINKEGQKSDIGRCMEVLFETPPPSSRPPDDQRMYMSDLFDMVIPREKELDERTDSMMHQILDMYLPEGCCPPITDFEE